MPKTKHIHVMCCQRKFLANTKGAVLITDTSEGGIAAETVMTLAWAKPKQIILADRTEAKVTPVLEEPIPNKKNCRIQQ